MHHVTSMPNRVPRTYDEITRETVPDPDTSWRPSDRQEQEAYAGHRALDGEEQDLFDDVVNSLAASGEDITRVQIEIDRDRVILRGQVRSPTALGRVVDVVRSVGGVRGVIDYLVIASH